MGTDVPAAGSPKDLPLKPLRRNRRASDQRSRAETSAHIAAHDPSERSNVSINEARLVRRHSAPAAPGSDGCTSWGRPRGFRAEAGFGTRPAFIGSSVPVLGRSRLVGKSLSLCAPGRSDFARAAVKHSSKSVVELILPLFLIQAPHLEVILVATDGGSFRVRAFRPSNL